MDAEMHGSMRLSQYRSGILSGQLLVCPLLGRGRWRAWLRLGNKQLLNRTLFFFVAPGTLPRGSGQSGKGS